MALPTVAEFRAFFPEFAFAPIDAVVQLHLTAASASVNEDVYDEHYSQAILWLAAHGLATSPHGADAKLAENAPIQTRYWIRFDQIRRGIGPQTVAL